LPFIFLFVWLAYQEMSAARRWPAWPLLHLAIAIVYCAIWISVPRLGGVTGTGFQPLALGYLLQAVAYVPAHLATGWLNGWPAVGLIALNALVVAILAVGAWKSQGRGPTLLCCLWIVAGLLPPWAGLSWDYVKWS